MEKTKSIFDQKNFEYSWKPYTRLNYTAIRGANHFAWPDMKDVIETLNEDILMKKVTIEVLNSCGYFDLKKLKQLMVFVHKKLSLILLFHVQAK